MAKRRLRRKPRVVIRINGVEVDPGAAQLCGDLADLAASPWVDEVVIDMTTDEWTPPDGIRKTLAMLEAKADPDRAGQN